MAQVHIEPQGKYYFAHLVQQVLHMHTPAMCTLRGKRLAHNDMKEREAAQVFLRHQTKYVSTNTLFLPPALNNSYRSSAGEDTITG